MKEGDNSIEVRAKDAAGNSVVVLWEMERESPIRVSTSSWIIILIVIIVIGIVGVWTWKKRKEDL